MKKIILVGSSEFRINYQVVTLLISHLKTGFSQIFHTEIPDMFEVFFKDFPGKISPQNFRYKSKKFIGINLNKQNV